MADTNINGSNTEKHPSAENLLTPAEPQKGADNGSAPHEILAKQITAETQKFGYLAFALSSIKIGKSTFPNEFAFPCVQILLDLVRGIDRLLKKYKKALKLIDVNTNGYFEAFRHEYQEIEEMVLVTIDLQEDTKKLSTTIGQISDRADYSIPESENHAIFYDANNPSQGSHSESARDQAVAIMDIYRTLNPEHQAAVRKRVSDFTAIEENEKIAQSPEAEQAPLG